MLNDLKVLNGNLELKYNEYTYEYTVTVEENINNLELEYILEDDCYIEIRNNELNFGENTVYIDVYNIDEKITYTLYVYKENSNVVNGIDDYKKTLEIVTTNEVALYKVQLLSIGIFLIIIIVFSLIFRRKKVYKQK
ncbi:MAG: hypothetical protein E7161_04630 [Firmicutes bacterium]|nr:hypothetical protein [Bacillota bacterium]